VLINPHITTYLFSKPRKQQTLVKRVFLSFLFFPFRPSLANISPFILFLRRYLNHFSTIRPETSLFLEGSFYFQRELEVRKRLRLIANTGDTGAHESVCEHIGQGKTHTK
jgi:hypothetical protein